MSKRKVILDVDPGIDDARAILFLIYTKQVDILALTTIGGNSYSVHTAYNATLILNSVNRNDIPVYMTIPNNMMDEVMESDGFFGKNGMCGVVLPDSGIQPILDKLSHEVIVELVNKYPNEINIISLGPATNVARAFMIDNELPNKIQQLFLMGTDSSEITRFNVTEYAEFNSYSDPKAMSIVLDNFGKIPNKPICLIDFKLCLSYQILGTFFDNIANLIKTTDKTKSDTASIFEARPDEFKNSKIPINDRTLIIADEFAVLAFYNPNFITSSRKVLLKHIDITGTKRGHTEYEDNNNNGNIQLVEQINLEIFQNEYIKVFSKSLD